MTVRRHDKTRKNVPWKGWVAPGTHQRTLMRKKCGKKCFLGPSTCNCFPICDPGTCKINNKGVWAAYIRSREYGSPRMRARSHASGRHTKKMYKKIASRAKALLKK